MPPDVRRAAAMVLLTIGSAAPASGQTPTLTDSPLRLDVRVFDGTADVTGEARVRLFKAGYRTDPRALGRARGEAFTVEVVPGFYDLQAVRERDGRVIAIRWAERRHVARYPDEHGRHLEVVNLQLGFGALEVRGPSAHGGVPRWGASLHQPGENGHEVAGPVKGDGYLLFVAPSGFYDLKVTPPNGDPQWMRDIELPADRTRLKTWQ
jgi:hypothetical protein